MAAPPRLFHHLLLPLLPLVLSWSSAAVGLSSWAHPGVVVGPGQLAFSAAQAAAGVQPFNETLADALRFTWVTDRNASSMSAGWNGSISCGFFSRPDYGCTNESNDAQAAELQAMLWAYTRDEKWASRALAIMNFYARRLERYEDWGNGRLQAAWSADKWARAAELLSSTGAPWAAADRAAFAAMLERASVPMLFNGSCDNGNWELSMIEGLAGIAVFTENATLLGHAADMWRARVPAYFYYAPEDGPRPAPAPPGCRAATWENQVVFNASVNGVAQETCRDFGHTQFGVASAFNAAETFLAQGIDLYTPNRGRLAAAVEFHTAILVSAGIPIRQNISLPLVCNGTALRLSDAPTFQIALTGLSRVGYSPASLPSTAAYVRAALWPAYYNQGCNAFMMCYEALTHGAPAP